MTLPTIPLPRKRPCGHPSGPRGGLVRLCLQKHRRLSTSIPSSRKTPFGSPPRPGPGMTTSRIFRSQCRHQRISFRRSRTFHLTPRRSHRTWRTNHSRYIPSFHSSASAGSSHTHSPKPRQLFDTNSDSPSPRGHHRADHLHEKQYKKWEDKNLLTVCFPEELSPARHTHHQERHQDLGPPHRLKL